MSVKRQDLSGMCRLCLTKDTTILDVFYFSDEMSNQLSNIIMSFAPVQIKRHDEMPNSICRLCYTQLKNIYKFQVQIVESDKTLRRYLQQLHTSDQQNKPEFSIQNSSEEHLFQKTNNSEKFESIIFHDIFGTNLTNNEVAPLNCNSLNEEIPLKLEIKDEPTDDNSLNLTECVDDSVETLSKGDGSVFVSENTKVDVSFYTKLDRHMYSIGNDNNFKSANTINQDMLLKIEDEATNDNSSNLIECSDNTVETLYKMDDSEICRENLKINRDHISGNNVAECLDKSEEINSEKHKESAEKKYYCNICNKSFNKFFTLKPHMRIHTSEKPYQCDICNKSFRQINALNYHKRTHTGEKPYQCDVCNLCFSRSDALKRHKRTHTGEKPHQCDVCNKKFSRLCHLILHKRTHTGEKPYQCDECNKCFRQINALNYHKRTHTAEASSV